WPALSSRKTSESRIAASSSMTWITASVMCCLLGTCSFQGEAEGRTAARRFLRGNTSAMGFDDGARDGQAHAHALRLGGDERLEQLIGDVAADAGAGIGDGDFDPAGLRHRGEIGRAHV